MPPRTRWRFREERDTVQGYFYLGGRRHLRTIATAQEARGRSEEWLLARWEAAYKRLLAEAPASRTAPGQARLAAVWQDWMDELAPLRRPNTLKYYALTGNELRATLGDPVLRAFGAAEAADFTAAARARGLSVASVNIRLKVVKAFLRWAHARNFLPAPPAVPLLRIERKLPKVPTDAQLAAWLRSVQRAARWRPGERPLVLPDGRTFRPGALQRLTARRREWFILVARDTGLRLSEWFYTPLSAYDTDAGHLDVRYQPRFNVKEGREKRIPLTRRVRRLVRALRRVRPDWRYFLDDGTGKLAYATVDNFGHSLGRGLRAFGLGGQGFKPAHLFRAHFAQRLLAAGVDRVTIRDLLGHADIKVTDGYFPQSGVAGQAAIARLEQL